MKQFFGLCLFVSLRFTFPFSFATGIASRELSQSVDQGVGFSLSLDYGCVGPAIVPIPFGNTDLLPSEHVLSTLPTELPSMSQRSREMRPTKMLCVVYRQRIQPSILTGHLCGTGYSHAYNITYRLGFLYIGPWTAGEAVLRTLPLWKKCFWS